MLLRPLIAASALATAANAFKDASPFFMVAHGANGLDTSTLQSSTVASTEELSRNVLASLQSCAFDQYVVVSQPGARTSDYQTASAMPGLRNRMQDVKQEDGLNRAVEVGSVLGGGVDGGYLTEMLEKKCGGRKTMALNYEVLPLKQKARKKALDDNDAHLAGELQRLNTNTSYVLIYTTTPPTHQTTQPEDFPAAEYQYEMDDPYPSAWHQDLKRQLSSRADSSSNATNPQANLALFEKYSFLTPGLFMSLSISLLLLVILYVGITAISGLTVSYAAFAKEMGPNAQRPKQG